ncbi:MAG: aldehyde dehydrogenase family protein [Actinobacteria bacterium]|nr:aldehyde dehydrogenase family protein [Actinomycetota bacterium]
MESAGLFIDGAQRPAASGATHEVTDPATGQPWLEVALGGAEDVDAAVAAAARAVGSWSRRPAPERAAIVRQAAAIARERHEHLAQTESRDVGKPINDARVEMASVADVFDFYAGVVRGFGGETLSVPAGGFDYTLRQAVGVVGLITPWNFPGLIATWKLAPALAAGNAVVLKPALLTPASALEIASILHDAGVPPGIINVVPGRGSAVGEAIVGHADVRKIAFTGSTEVGIGIQQAAAASLKRVTLELGGKSPNIIFDDADLEAAAVAGVEAVFGNAGQDCCARSRIIVADEVHDAFVEALVAAAEDFRVGDPADEDTQMGPLVSDDQRQTALDYLASARDEGATVACGGQVLDRSGYFMRPAVVDDATPEMTAVREEIFGPVVTVLRFGDEAEAVAMANDTPYGLSASVWTRDLGRAHRMARDIEAGVVSVNSNSSVHTGAPFGGWKQSGYGRELGLESLRAYTELKNVYVDISP